jgi:hypothetical protein
MQGQIQGFEALRRKLIIESKSPESMHLHIIFIQTEEGIQNLTRKKKKKN